jgi:hypothetical protein
MSSIADRNRERLIKQLDGDPRIGKDKVLSAVPMIRGSFVMLVLWGVVAAMLAQIGFGTGGLQFGIGLFIGYAAYVIYLLVTMGPPRVIGAMAVLTKNKLVLLGTRRAGIVAEWPRKNIEAIDVLRRGNLLTMGKIRILPSGEDGILFYLSNRQLGRHFVETFDKGRRS